MKICVAILIFLTSQSGLASELLCDGLNADGNVMNGIKFHLNAEKMLLSFTDGSNNQYPFPKDFITQSIVSAWLPAIRFDRTSDCVEASEVKVDGTMRHSFKCETTIVSPEDTKLESFLEIAPDKKSAIYNGTTDTGIEADFSLKLTSCFAE